MEGVTITMADGYPAALAAGITAAMQDLTGFGTPVYGAGPVIATYDTDGGTAGTCTVVFAEPLAAGDAPIVTVTTTGC